MATSASEALAQFKARNAGFLNQTAQAAMATTTPKAQPMSFLSTIRDSGQRANQIVLDDFAARRRAAELARQQAAAMRPSGSGNGSGAGYPSSGYRAPNGNADRESKSGAYGYQAFGGRYGLTVPASDSFTRLEQQFKRQFGVGFSVTHGWRSVAEEQRLANKYKGTGVTTSKPGSGVHGYGTAVDLGGGLTNTNSKQHAWMRQNAAYYGWFWVGKTWNEPWHWEYFPSKDQSRRG